MHCLQFNFICSFLRVLDSKSYTEVVVKELFPQISFMEGR